MSELGFKKLTLENWRDPDPIMQFFGDPTPAEHYVNEILSPSIVGETPKDVRALFEVARGAMLYGYLFYPLFTLGSEQMYRVIETAVRFKCIELGLSKKQAEWFAENIQFLKDKAIVNDKYARKLGFIRKFRNWASHPDMQSIQVPGHAIVIARLTANMINMLFDPDWEDVESEGEKSARELSELIEANFPLRHEERGVNDGG